MSNPNYPQTKWETADEWYQDHAIDRLTLKEGYRQSRYIQAGEKLLGLIQYKNMQRVQLIKVIGFTSCSEEDLDQHVGSGVFNGSERIAEFLKDFYPEHDSVICSGKGSEVGIMVVQDLDPNNHQRLGFYPVLGGKIYAPFTKTEAIRPDEISYQDVTFIGLE